MQVSTKSLVLLASFTKERTNIMFMVQIGDLIRATHRNHQVSLPSVHSMTICRVYTCAVVFGSSSFSTGEHSSSCLPGISRVAGGLLRV